MASSVTGWFSGAPMAFQSGNSSVSDLRVKHRAREDVGTGLGAFFKHHHRDVAAFLGSELFQADGGGQAGGAAADHDHVVVHGFAGAVLGQDVLGGHGVSRFIKLVGQTKADREPALSSTD